MEQFKGNKHNKSITLKTTTSLVVSKVGSNGETICLE